jgi:hypothetical protein
VREANFTLRVNTVPARRPFGGRFGYLQSMKAFFCKNESDNDVFWK